MGHPNLSAGLNVLVDAGNNPMFSLSLKHLIPGSVVTLTLVGPDGSRSVEVQIEKPTGNDPFKEFASGKVIRSNHPEVPSVGSPIELIGSCTNNPGAPLGMSMYHAGTLTVGRNPVLSDGNKAFFLKLEVIEKISVIIAG